MARSKRIETTYTKPNGDFLIIFETSFGLRGEVRNIKDARKVVMSASFYTADGDASPYRVKEYFNF